VVYTTDDELVRQALPIVKRLARQAWRRLNKRVELEDLVALGCAGAFDAVRRFDPLRARFIPYVTQRVRWTLMTEVRREARRARREAGVVALGGIHPPRSPDPQHALMVKRTSTKLRATVATLDEPARSLLERHYYDEQRIDQAADDLGLHKSTAHRIHKNAVRDLRRKLVRTDEIDTLSETLPSPE
jgi:RNA polymerase sigma factor for flagellar operon FliA